MMVIGGESERWLEGGEAVNHVSIERLDETFLDSERTQADARGMKAVALQRFVGCNSPYHSLPTSTQAHRKCADNLYVPLGAVTGR